MSEAILTNSPNPEAAIDPDTIGQLRELGDGDELLFELIGLYLEDAPARLDAIEAAASSGDAANLGALAHSLKSSCANVGALTMAQICKGLEQAGKQGTLEEHLDLVPMIKAEWNMVSQRLADILAS